LIEYNSYVQGDQETSPQNYNRNILRGGKPMALANISFLMKLRMVGKDVQTSKPQNTYLETFGVSLLSDLPSKKD
jgi:hypothetical protein